MAVLVKFPIELFAQVAAAKVNFGIEGVGQGSPHQLKALLMESGFVFNEVSTTFANSGIVRLATPVISGVVETTGILGAGTYYYQVTAINSAGQTIGSSEDNVTIGASKGVQVSWSAVDGATGYRIYGRSGIPNLLMGEVGEVTTWTDDGTVTPGVTDPPSSDTTGAEIATGGGYTVNSKVIGNRTLQRDNINRRYEIIAPPITWNLSGTVGPAAGLIILDTNEASLADQPIVAYIDFGGDKAETAPADFIIPSQRIRFKGLIGG